MSRRVFITGLACATAAGIAPGSLLECLRARRYALQRDHGTVGDHPIRNVGVIDRQALGDLTAGTSGRPHLPTALVTRLVTEALADAGLGLPRPPEEELRILLATSFGSPFDYLELYRFRSSPRKDPDAPILDDIKDLRFREDRMTEVLQQALGCGVHKLCVGMQCSASVQAILMAAAQLRSGQADRVLVGAYDFFEPFHYQLMRGAGLVDEGVADPFGVAHAGCNFGDGAVILVLEGEDALAARGAGCAYAEVLGGATRCYPASGGPPAPAIRETIDAALTDCGLTPDAVDLVCPHGCGIPDMDRSESIALRRAFGPRLAEIPVAVYSPFVGYTFSSSGFVDIAALLGTRRDRVVAPGYAPRQPDAVSDFRFLTEELEHERARTILKLKLAYSGAVGGVLLRPACA